MAKPRYLNKTTISGIVTNEKTVDKNTVLEARRVSPLYFSAKTAVKAAAGIAVWRINTWAGSEGSLKKYSPVTTSSGINRRRTKDT